MISNFSWNIKTWLSRFLFPRRRKPTPLALTWAILSPLQAIVDDFAARAIVWRFTVQYNSQQAVLASMLNKLFDPTDLRIRVVTTGDLTPPVVIFQDNEFDPQPDFIYHDGEDVGNVIIYHQAELDALPDYIVYVPTSLTAEEPRIRGWINRYNLADKNYQIIYE
jgi:hypothetical protein